MADTSNVSDYWKQGLYGLGAFLSGILGYRKFGKANAANRSSEIDDLRKRMKAMEADFAQLSKKVDNLSLIGKKVEEMDITVESSALRQRKIEVALSDLQREFRDGMQVFSDAIDRFSTHLKRLADPRTS